LSKQIGVPRNCVATLINDQIFPLGALTLAYTINRPSDNNRYRIKRAIHQSVHSNKRGGRVLDRDKVPASIGQLRLNARMVGISHNVIEEK
jgi:hypothetical protein